MGHICNVDVCDPSSLKTIEDKLQNIEKECYFKVPFL